MHCRDRRKAAPDLHERAVTKNLEDDDDRKGAEIGGSGEGGADAAHGHSFERRWKRRAEGRERTIAGATDRTAFPYQ